MRVCRDRPVVRLSRSSVVTIGNFDGVHRGHRALIDRCRSLQGSGDDLAVVTFEPLPLAFFRPDEPPSRLSSPAERIRLLREAGAGLVWILRFDRRLAEVGAEEFVSDVLVESLGARHVVMGDDFRFGHKRQGDLALMRRLGARHGFEAHVADTVTLDGQRISSGAIREALARSDFAHATRLLGRPYAITGRVLRGRQLGRRLGYPTANVAVRALPSPVLGVFAVRARVADGAWRAGVANLGRRPAVGGEELLLEVHFFDYGPDLYGQRLETQFVAKLRDEAHFDTMEELVRQMKKDEARARAILNDEQWITE